MLVKKIEARKILCSNKAESIEVSVNGIKASCPAGTSKGRNETPSFHELGIDYSIKLLNALGKEIKFPVEEFDDLEKVEEVIRQIYNFSSAKKIGANALVALEIALLRGIAKEQGKELWEIVNPDVKKVPRGLGNCIGGGLHNKSGNTEFQEFLFSPITVKFSDAKFLNMKAYDLARKLLKEKDNKFGQDKDEENAWISYLDSEQILNVMDEVRDKIGEIDIGLDVAASSFLKGQTYDYKSGAKKSEEQIKYIADLVQKHRLIYVEDALHEEDFNGFSMLKKLTRNCLICGDDLTATQLLRLKKAMEKDSINAMIVKANQNGSLSEVKKVCELAKANDIKIIFSHRAGETNDYWLADLAFAFEADFMKAGIIGKEREAKLNRMIEIENSL